MKGLWLEDGAARVRDDLARPEPKGGETRVRVRVAGVCATDLALLRGYMGFVGVPGHEFVGVAESGPLAGRRVVGEINAGCGECERCRGGDPRHCARRTVLGIQQRPGAFAEELALPLANLLPVPDDVSDVAATFTEPLAAALGIAENAAIEPGMRVVVAGDGRLGLLCAHAVARSGAEVTVAGRHPERADLLPEGVSFATGLLEDGAPTDRRWDVAVEATGNPSALARLLPQVKPRGTVVLKTTTERDPTVPLWRVVVDELRLVGSRCGRFAPALELLASGAVPVERFVDATFSLDDAPSALARAGEKSTLKVLITPGG